MLHPVTKHNLSVISISDLNDFTFILRTERKNLGFTSGQFVNLGLPGGNTTREYSIYSGVDDPWLDFLIKEIPDGALSPKLRRLKAGEIVSIDGPYDEHFTIKPKRKNKPHFLIATGTGISPFHSFVKSFPDLNYTVLHGIKWSNDQYDRALYEPSRYISCVSQDDKGDFKGRVTDYLQANLPASESYIYLCGNSAMIYQVTDLLKKNRFKEDQIFSETFF